MSRSQPPQTDPPPARPPKPQPAPTGPGRLYSVTEVAKLWDCSVQHVYNLIADGRLSVVDIGGGRRPKTRIAAAELDAYIKRNQRRAPRGRAA